MNMKKCVVCGKEFKPYRDYHKFCSVECRLNFQREKRETAKKLHLCISCGVPIEKGRTRTHCESCREKERARERARVRRKSKALQEEKLTAVLCEIDRYNHQNGKHLSYGQYMLKKRDGEIL